MLLCDAGSLPSQVMQMADCFFADPPYGCSLGTKITGAQRRRRRPAYLSFVDTPENVRKTCVPIIERLVKLEIPGCVTPGKKCLFDYPKPADMGVWFSAASTGWGSWGRDMVQAHVLWYGKSPYSGRLQPGRLAFSSPYGIGDSGDDSGRRGPCLGSPSFISRGNAHPCPKPLNLMKWIVARISKPGQLVFDPFMGSGTTGVAAVQLGRRFLGVEIEPVYFEAACQRIEDAQRQDVLFAS